MKRSRRNHTAAFKAKVARAAIKGDQTVAELAKEGIPYTFAPWLPEIADSSTR